MKSMRISTLIWLISEPMMNKSSMLYTFISSLMDCVGCEKCRLWGKLQILGLGTALKILFSANGAGDTGPAVELQRNEVIALINLLYRLSELVKLVHETYSAIDTSILNRLGNYVGMIYGRIFGRL
ncbi:hypothetical protein Droror1_Dr00017418 [Drosera rotundifolia]